MRTAKKNLRARIRKYERPTCGPAGSGSKEKLLSSCSLVVYNMIKVDFIYCLFIAEIWAD